MYTNYDEQALDRLLTRLQARGHRVMIFSQWTHSLLDILDDFLFHRGVCFVFCFTFASA